MPSPRIEINRNTAAADRFCYRRRRCTGACAIAETAEESATQSISVTPGTAEMPTKSRSLACGDQERQSADYGSERAEERRARFAAVADASTVSQTPVAARCARLEVGSCGGSVQCDRRTVRCGTDHGYHRPSQAAPSGRRGHTALWRLARAAPIAVTGCALSGLVGGAFRPVLPLLLRLWALRLQRRRPLAASAVGVFIRQMGGDDPRG